MRGTLLLVALASALAANGCTSSADRPGEGGGDTFSTVTSTTGAGLTSTSGTGAMTTGSTTGTMTTGTTTTGTTTTGTTTTGTTTTGGMMGLAEPLYPYCGCVTDNLASAGLCRSCWQDAMAMDGACEDIMTACGPACTAFLNALDSSCATDVATPDCLDAAVAAAPAQVDDFEALLGCLCDCQDCDSSACM